MKKISVKRKNELTKIYSNADMIGRAFVEYFIEKEKARKNPDFQMTLNAEEISFIRSNLKTEEDKTVFDRYLLIKRILANYDHWIEYYQQIFYHGLFRALSIIQPVESDLEKLRFLCSQEDSEETQEQLDTSLETLNTNLNIINDILMPNWKNLILVGIRNLHPYVFSLKHIEELTKFDFDIFTPDISHHEYEITILQRNANRLISNLEYSQKTIPILGKLENKFENTIKTIEAFCQIDLSVTRKSEEECKKKEEDLLYNIYTAKDVIA